MKNGGGGAPENKLLKEDFLGFALELFGFKNPIFPYHPEDEIRRISKKSEREIFCSVQNDRKCAFTLAEVLITLGVIGIVASMTIPQLIKNYQAKVLETGFKKAYSNLSKAYLMTQQELGVTNIRKTVLAYDSTSGTYPLINEFHRVFYKNLGVSKDAKEYLIKNYNNTKSFYTVSSNHSGGWGNIRTQKILPDGSSYGVRVSGSYINFYVDTNGPYQKPNRMGFDIFVFGVIDNQDIIKPVKMTKLYTEEELEEQSFPDGAGLPCSIHSNQKYNGYGCSYYAMNDINPDDNKSGYWKNLPK